MDGTCIKLEEESILDNRTTMDAVTTRRDMTVINSSKENDHVVGSSKNSEIQGAIGSADRSDHSFADKKSTSSEDPLLSSSAVEPSKGGCAELTEEDECRICQSRGEEVLISPCKCAGSAKWVHESCLVKWFQISQTTSCELCSRFVVIRKRTKPFQQWRIPRDGLGPCSRLDLWYLFVTIFSICTILGFGIFQMLVKSKEPETTAVFAAIYALCGIMILLRIHYFYVWFTRRSKFWRKWKTENRVWTVASPGTVLKYNEEGTIV